MGVRFTYHKGADKYGTTYISLPEAVGWIAQLRWPVGGRADITKLEYRTTSGLEGFILAALRFEETDR
ncbi:MAG: hypothetical protein LUP99_01900 [Methanomicrobiales archaeon]|nr:hypothetical protein [Methanomicrobiales archaeon]